ncbi:MAG: lactate utilization protein C [Kiloniellales bacterium]
MSSPDDQGREQVLGALRRAIRSTQLPEQRRAAVEARLKGHPQGPQPQRAQRPHVQQIALFAEMAREVQATVAEVATADQVPRAIADYLKSENLPAALRIAPDPALKGLPWDGQPLLQVQPGRAEPGDEVSVTHAFAGIAETGTLMLLSGSTAATTLSFLPDNNVVVLPAEAVVGRYEEAWERLRARCGGGLLPRTVNLITGPSRTADIEQTIQLGAHGPRRLHIVIVGGASA